MPKPEDFYSDNPPPRIIGTETEYTAEAMLYGKEPKVSQEKLLSLIEEIGLSTTPGIYTSNGSRIYVDVGQHLEYATPESLGPLEAALTDHAGMAIIEKMYDSVSRSEPPRKNENRIPLRRSGAYDFKKGDFVTAGYHENYCLPAMDPERIDVLGNVLPLHLATRQLWYGNGFVADQFTMSQKAKGIGAGLVIGWGSRLNEGTKPMVGLQTEQFEGKTSKGWRIAEVRFGDPSMFPYTTYLGHAATSLVIRLIEQGVIDCKNANSYSLNPSSLLATKDKLNKDIHGFNDTKYPLRSGEQLSAVEIQRRLATLAVELSHRVKLPIDEVNAARDWLNICNLMSDPNIHDDNFAALVGKVEWATKYHYLNQAHRNKQSIVSKGLDINNMDAVSFDIQWTSLYEGSIGKLIASRRSPFADEFKKNIEHYILNPPAHTRALARAALIRDYRVKTTEWSSTMLDGPPPDTLIQFRDPYQPNLAKAIAA